MAKTFGLVMMLVALYIGMTIYTKGIDQFVGNAFEPIQPGESRESAAATHLTPGAQIAAPPTERSRGGVRLADSVRDRVNKDMKKGARRRGY